MSALGQSAIIGADPASDIGETMPAARGDSPKDVKDDADRAAVPMGLIAAT